MLISLLCVKKSYEMPVRVISQLSSEKLIDSLLPNNKVVLVAVLTFLFVQCNNVSVEVLDLGVDVFPLGRARLLIAAAHCNVVLLLDVHQSFIPQHGDNSDNSIT